MGSTRGGGGFSVMVLLAGLVLMGVGLAGCGSSSTDDAASAAPAPASTPAVAYARATAGTLSLSDGWISDAGMSGMSGMSGMKGMKGMDDGELAGYAILRNTGAIGERLVSVSSPQATDVELHATTDEGSAATMRRIDGLAVPAGATVRFAIGGYHVMLAGLKGHPTAGDRVELAWTFASGTVLHASFPVLDPEDRPGL